MEKSEIIKSVVSQLKAADIKPTFVSEPDDCDVIVRLRDPKPPYTKTTVKITGEEIAAYGGKIGAEPIDPKGKKLEEVARTRVRHALELLDDIRPKELQAQAAARRIAEGR